MHLGSEDGDANRPVGDQKASGIHVEDLARLYVLALEKAPAGSTYHTTSGPGYTAKCAHFWWSGCLRAHLAVLHRLLKAYLTHVCTEEGKRANVLERSLSSNVEKN